MNKIKKIFNAIAISSLLVVPSVINASAASRDTSGSASGITFDGQGWTVVKTGTKYHCNGGKVSINKMGSGKGDIKYGAYCCAGHQAPKNYYKTFEEAGSYTFDTDLEGIWAVDGKNASVTKTRRNASVSWELD